MRHPMVQVAAVVMMTVALMGCSATADDAGGALAASEATNVIPTDQPSAATATVESAPKDNPLDGLEPCDLISDEEAAQLELDDAQPRGEDGADACSWRYTGDSDETVHAVVGFQPDGSSLDELIELGNEPVPGTLGTHQAAVGAFEEGGGLLCRVSVVVGESNVNIGTASKGFTSPSDPLCGDFTNELARLIEPKLPVAEASASASATEESSEDDPLAQVQPCDLLSDEEAAQLGLSTGAGNEQGGEAQTCAWLNEGDGLGVFVSFESAGIGEIAGDNITPVPSIGSHDAVTFTSTTNLPSVAIGVSESSRVQVQVSTMQLGESPDPAKAGQLAMDVATSVEPKLP